MVEHHSILWYPINALLIRLLGVPPVEKLSPGMAHFFFPDGKRAWLPDAAIMALLLMTLIAILFPLAAKKFDRYRPGGVQNFLEMLVSFLRGLVAETVGEHHIRRASRDPIGGHRDRFKARCAETIDGHRRRADRQPRAKRRNSRDVQPLFGLRHRTAENDVVDLRRIDAGRSGQRLAQHDRRQLIRSREAQRTRRRLADSGANCGDDDGCGH